MANTRFQHKRSTVSGVTPTTSDIAAGELGLNLADRRIFTSNGSAVFELGSNLTSLSVSGNAVITGSANAANVTAALFTGNVTGTASNATNLNSQPGSFYTNATNLATGTVPTARLGSGTANSTTFLAGDQTYKTVTVSAVTSVATGNGLTGGPITSTGTVSVLSNSGITANSTGLFVTQGTGTVVNSTGVHVNSTYIGTLTANNSTNLNGQPASFYTNATNLTTGTLNNARLPSTISVSAVNASTFGIGSAISLFSQGANGFSVNENFSVGNNSITGYHFTSGAGRSSVVFTLARTDVFTSGFGVTGNTSNNDFIIGGEFSNTNLIFKTGLGMPFNVAGGTVRFTVANSGLVTLTNNLHAGNSTSNLQLSNTTLVISNSTTTTTVGLTDIRLGNSTVNTFINASGLTTAANVLINATGELVISPGAGIFANGSLGTAGQVLSSNGTSVYWTTVATGGVRSVSITTASTITPTSDTADQYNVTALASSPATIAAPSGSPTNGQKLVIRLKDNGTGRTLNWTTTSGGYRAIGVTLPNTTVANKTTYVGCIYNATDTFWDVVASVTEA
jgi:hypothetical protein